MSAPPNFPNLPKQHHSQSSAGVGSPGSHGKKSSTASLPKRRKKSDASSGDASSPARRKKISDASETARRSIDIQVQQRVEIGLFGLRLQMDDVAKRVWPCGG